MRRVGPGPDAVHRAAVGLLPLPHDARRLKALRIAPVAVAEDHRRIVEERQRREVLVGVQGAQVGQVVVVRAELQRVGPAEQRHVVADLDHVDVRRRSAGAAGAGVDRRERQARREDVDVREVSRVVLARDDTVHVAEAVMMVHVAGELVQPAVAQHPAVLDDGAPEMLEAVHRLAHVVVRRRELVVPVACPSGPRSAPSASDCC